MFEEEKHDSKEEPLVLVGQVIGGRIYTEDTIARVMEKAWRLSRSFTVKWLKKNCFKFSFQHPFDLFKVKNNGPWLINQHPLVLKDWPTNMLLKDIDFTRIPCWINIHNLPPSLISKENARRFGMMTEGIATHDERQFEEGGRTSVLRVKVNLDITQPLTVWLNGQRLDRAYQRLKVTYDKLPEFFFYCGRIGHVDKDCRKKFEDEVIRRLELSYKWGAWLRS